MPKSRIRKRGQKAGRQPKSGALGPSPPWLAPLMVGLFVLGLLWIVIYYVSNGGLPIDALDNYNLVIGLGFIIGGFIASTQWR